MLPFDLDPAGPEGLDRFTAYWYVTILDAVYRPSSFPRLALWAVAGATAVQRVGAVQTPYPAADVGEFPSNRAIVACRGTQTDLELIAQIVGLPLAPIFPWPGEVGAFWSVATSVLAAGLLPVLDDLDVDSVAVSGHSYGASVATLLPALLAETLSIPTECVCSAGGPRTGSLSFAAQWTLPYLRLTNAADPVPMLPPSPNSVLDATLWILAPPPLNHFWHVGTRIHLFEDGSAAFPPEQSTWATSADALAALALGTQDWFRVHELAEYARRLRIGIDAPFNVASPDFPGIEVLDGYWSSRPIIPPASTWTTTVLCPEV